MECTNNNEYYNLLNYLFIHRCHRIMTLLHETPFFGYLNHHRICRINQHIGISNKSSFFYFNSKNSLDRCLPQCKMGLLGLVA